ncbi:MAG: hypothetical protein IKS71_00705 [Bacteroidales bacterium]|nr:hypothetical protein [Bacteroidales bacterium]
MRIDEYGLWQCLSNCMVMTDGDLDTAKTRLLDAVPGLSSDNGELTVGMVRSAVDSAFENSRDALLGAKPDAIRLDLGELDFNPVVRLVPYWVIDNHAVEMKGWDFRAKAAI